MAIQEGDNALPADMQLDRQLGHALMFAFRPKFHDGVPDFGAIQREDLKL